MIISMNEINKLSLTDLEEALDRATSFLNELDKNGPFYSVVKNVVDELADELDHREEMSFDMED